MLTAIADVPAWAKMQSGKVNPGDARRTNRAVRVAASIAEGGGLRNAGEAGASQAVAAAAAEGEKIVATVTDDGPGLPEPVRQALFRPFVTCGRAGGSGLGLVIAHDLARAHGGDLVLLRSGPDGTVFRLTLPATDAIPGHHPQHQE